MNRFLVTTAATMLVALPSAVFAATVTNRDAVAYTLVVTEGGQQLDIEISAGDTIEICPTGCFVVMPNGDREVLTGPERLEIESGRGKIL